MKIYKDNELIPIEVNQKWGFSNKKGSIIIPCKWKLVGFFHEGRAWVKSFSNRFGYIDNNGKLIASCIFVDASDFENGVASVGLCELNPIRDDLTIDDIIKLKKVSWIDIDINGMPLDSNEDILNYLCRLENYFE
ncbi:WG containing repeat-containing protein [Xylanibacter ruminicola]|uniref:WG containing repeat-containing protein n=1 Tax=Xylanibacter ruminicola TaxID=839 RepID=A0A1M7CQF3_XYLRU|nr:WG repeat-containing protein [Xylanibacter ruminicola]SHL69501.1 WG containing repeat-containing protein [Xylanibacter ruminicola]